MITKSDWQAVHHQLMADERRKIGDPPTAEEMLAYTRGELPAEAEARVRERLVLHPDLVRTLTEPFPTEGAEPGDPDYLPDEEFTKHWAAMQQRLGREKPAAAEGRVLQFWRVSTAIAAALAVLFGALLWQTVSKLSEPRVIGEHQVLLPEATRGPGVARATPLTPHGDHVGLVLTSLDGRGFDRLRVEMLRGGDGRSVWRSGSLPWTAETNERFTVVVPRRFLEPGTYRIVVYGLAGGSEEHLASYSVGVPAP